MGRKSILTRASYLWLALILSVATVPLAPLGAMALGADGCLETAAELTSFLDGQETSATLCGDITPAGNTIIGRPLTLDLAGASLNGKIIIRNDAEVTIKNGSIAGSSAYGTDSTIYNSFGKLTLENVNVYGNGTGLAAKAVYNMGSGNNISTLTIRGGSFAGVDGADAIHNNNGIISIEAGTFSTRPNDAWVADGSEVYDFGDHFAVDTETSIRAQDVTLPEGGEADLFSVTPATINGTDTNEVSTHVFRSNGAEVNADATITTSANNSVINGHVVANYFGSHTYTVANKSGKSETKKLSIYRLVDKNDTNRNLTNALDTMVLSTHGDDANGVEPSFKTHGVNVRYTMSSADENVATVDGNTIKPVHSGKTTITVTFADSVNTQKTFDVYVYDFDETEDTQPLILKKGETADIHTDSHWGVTTAGDATVSVASGQGGVFTLTAGEVGETELTFSTDVDGKLETAKSKTVKVYVYDMTETEIWVDANDTSYTLYSGLNAPAGLGVSASSSERSVANTNQDEPFQINGITAGDATLTYTLSADGAESKTEQLTVHVYTFTAKSEVRIDKGKTKELTGANVLAAGNPSALRAELADGEAYVSLSGNTLADGSFTTKEVGTATIKYYAGTKKIGETTVLVYAPAEFSDVVLSVNEYGADKSVNITASGENIPTIGLTSSNTAVASVQVLPNALTVEATGAGKATITVTYEDDFDQPTRTFAVYVSDFTRSDETRYDIALGEEVRIEAHEKNTEATVTCTVDGADCAQANDLAVSASEGIYTVTGNETGAYTMHFKDELAGTVIADYDVTVVVHDITLSESELFIKKDGEAGIVTATVAEGTNADLQYRVLKDGNEIAENSSISVAKSGDTYTITVNEAGQYELEFADIHDGNIVLTKSVDVYAIDFTVSPQEFHVKKGDTAQHLITALNKHWETTDADELAGFSISKGLHSESSYEFRMDDGLAAGDYTLHFYAKVNNETRDQKDVIVHVYEMQVNNRNNGDELYGEILTTFGAINVTDGNRGATITREIDGPAGGLLPIDLFGSNRGFTALRPGKYTVTYTDRMANGEIVDTYTVTMEVFNLFVDAKARGRVIEAGDYQMSDFYTINRALTYGETEVTYEVESDGTWETIDEFDSNVEGHYRFTITNKTAAEHGFTERTQFTFYIYKTVDDEMFIVRKGEGNTITIDATDSIWSLDRAIDTTTWTPIELIFPNTDYYTVNDDGTITVDVDKLDLGVHEIALQHDFGALRRYTIKNVKVYVYDIVADPERDETEITKDTLEQLFEGIVELANLVKESDLESLLDSGELTELGNAMTNGEVIRTLVDVQELDEADVAEDMVEAVDALNPTGVTYFDVSIRVYTDARYITDLHELTEPLTVALMEAEEPADGYSRQYILVAKHGDEEPIYLVEGEDFEIKDGMIYLISDRFSTFAVAYIDEKLPEAPNTGAYTATETGATVDNSAILLAVIALAAICGSIALRKTRES